MREIFKNRDILYVRNGLFGFPFLKFSIHDEVTKMKVVSLRLTDEEKKNLSHLSAKTGYSFSELIRYLIDNLDENSLEIALKKSDESDKKNRKVQQDLISELHYKNYLLGNIANNINQIAKYLNSKSDDIISDYEAKNLLQAFQTLEKRIDEIKSKKKLNKKEVDDRSGNN